MSPYTHIILSPSPHITHCTLFQQHCHHSCSREQHQSKMPRRLIMRRKKKEEGRIKAEEEEATKNIPIRSKIKNKGCSINIIYCSIKKEGRSVNTPPFNSSIKKEGCSVDSIDSANSSIEKEGRSVDTPCQQRY